MRHVLITGAGGFIGRRLTKTLLARPKLCWRGEDAPIGRLTLVDRHPFSVNDGTGIETRSIIGDLSDPAFRDSLSLQGAHSIFHLASRLTLEVEQDPDAAYVADIGTLRGLIDQTSAQPIFVYSSSIAAYGGLPQAVLDEAQAPAPETTYGTHKVVSELLIADASRHGRIDGRSLRLPIVVTRPRAGPGRPAISDLISAALREPLEGRDITLPLKQETIVPMASVGTVVAALTALHDAPGALLPAARAVNLPSFSVPIQRLAEEARQRATQPPARIAFASDRQVQAIVESWPAQLTSRYAEGLGIRPDLDVAALIADFLSHHRGQSNA